MIIITYDWTGSWGERLWNVNSLYDHHVTEYRAQLFAGTMGKLLRATCARSHIKKLSNKSGFSSRSVSMRRYELCETESQKSLGWHGELILAEIVKGLVLRFDSL
jgi:hypothetical protein